MTVRKRYNHFIHGEFRPPHSGNYRTSTSPVNLATVTQVADGNKRDVADAVASASDAVTEWRDRKPIERGRVLCDIARVLREQKEKLAEIESAETGKPLFQSPFEVEGAAAYFEYYGGLVSITVGEVVDMGSSYHAYTRREPFGVIGVITPWNAPLNQAARAIAPAVAMGNTVVAKPSEFTSATTAELASIAHECGLPAGVINVVLGDGPQVGAEIVQHPLVRKIAFTGSLRAGREIGKIAAERVIPVTLELGGKSANIIFDDAELAEAIPGSVRAFVANTGQVCLAGTRLLVQESIIDNVVEALKNAVNEIQAGQHIGPLITKAQYEKVLEYFKVAQSEGIHTVTGGEPVTHPDGGYFVPPTIYKTDNRCSRLYREEIFGPVLVVFPFKDETEAIELANDTEYGLVSGLWTRNLSRAHRVAAQLESGQVFVNEWVMGGVETPFGGYKQSGIGREKGLEALHHYTQLKCVIVKL